MTLFAIVLLVSCAKTGAIDAPIQRHPDIPDRPEELVADEIEFKPPLSTEFRHELPGGIPVFVLPGQETPLVTIALDFSAGEYLETPDQYGVADLTGTMIRSGGAGSLDPATLDDELSFLAAEVTTRVSLSRSTARINCLKESLDPCLDLLMAIVREPRFNEEKLAQYAGSKVDRMSRRNDNPDNIATREWQALLYGRDHTEARYAQAAVIEGLTKADLVAFHRRVFHPGNLVVSVVGDVETADILDRLSASFAGWEAMERSPDPAAPTQIMTPGLYHIERDISQSKVRIGMRGPQRDDPDIYALFLMARILGGGDFTARLMDRIRTQEGLSYAAWATMDPAVFYPGEFTAQFQTQGATTALAIQIAFEEFHRIRDEPVTDTELAGAKAHTLADVPRVFGSRDSMAEIFVAETVNRRDPRYYAELMRNIESVTVEDVQRVAKKWLRPDDMSILVVGDWEEISRGDAEGRANMSGFFGGDVQHLPLRDPFTLEPME